MQSPTSFDESIVIIEINCHKCGKNNVFTVSKDDDAMLACKKCSQPLFKSIKRKGYIYVISNQSLPLLFKIGFTKNVGRRISELNSSTSIPGEFDVELLFSSENPSFDERIIHEKLAKYRYNSNREFFKLDFFEVYQTIKKVLQSEPIYLKYKGFGELDLKKVNPWHQGNLISFIQKEVFYCKKCGYPTKHKHPKMKKGAEYYCRKCDISYGLQGSKL